MDKRVETFLNQVKQSNPHEKEFLQAVEEVVETVLPFIDENPKYQGKKLLERMVVPERVITFRVNWLDDQGDIQVNTGYRVEMNSAIGPYKGGLRFHPSVNLSILKFLGFEQVFKNSLTTLPLGGGKGGSDFNPKGKSDNEVMKFCQSFMTELSRHIGADTDVPAGDIGVGAREIGFLFGQYKRIRNEFTGILTGKELSYGGSLIRPEATGYGVVYFTEQVLTRKSESISDKNVVVSGSGNVAQYSCKKAAQLGARVITMSDSSGYIYVKDGIDQEIFDAIQDVKNNKRGRIKEVANQFDRVEYFDGQKPWDVNDNAEVVLPCATQNEVNKEDAQKLVDKNCKVLTEGANMPTSPEAIDVLQKNDILFSPGKASNAGGVAVSGLEMAQNSMRYSWTAEQVDDKLQDIMKDIHNACVKYGADDQANVNYVKGANIAGFVKVADAMLAQGVV
ncbi:MAG: NADP-specific glutamate dehydrogenase [Psychroflexus sp.]|nr:NADP-specific glutamate dehydrogenase [Psychroflexus sp.]